MISDRVTFPAKGLGGMITGTISGVVVAQALRMLIVKIIKIRIIFERLLDFVFLMLLGFVNGVDLALDVLAFCLLFLKSFFRFNGAATVILCSEEQSNRSEGSSSPNLKL